jgi:hypothetical protein
VRAKSPRDQKHSAQVLWHEPSRGSNEGSFPSASLNCVLRKTFVIPGSRPALSVLCYSALQAGASPCSYLACFVGATDPLSPVPMKASASIEANGTAMGAGGLVPMELRESLSGCRFLST